MTYRRTGDRVTVLNSSLGGRIVVEGEGTVQGFFGDAHDRLLIDGHDRVLVQFDGDSELSSRHIDPDAQGLTAAELEDYVSRLNAQAP